MKIISNTMNGNSGSDLPPSLKSNEQRVQWTIKEKESDYELFSNFVKPSYQKVKKDVIKVYQQLLTKIEIRKTKSFILELKDLKKAPISEAEFINYLCKLNLTKLEKDIKLAEYGKIISLTEMDYALWLKKMKVSAEVSEAYKILFVKENAGDIKLEQYTKLYKKYKKVNYKHVANYYKTTLNRYKEMLKLASREKRYDDVKLIKDLVNRLVWEWSLSNKIIGNSKEYSKLMKNQEKPKPIGQTKVEFEDTKEKGPVKVLSRVAT